MVRRARVDLVVLVGYAALSFAYFGWRLLPHPGRSILGLPHDPEISIWSFGWWPHAIGSFTNLFVSHALYAPSGVNLTWTPSVPGLALVFSPVTALFGPVAAFNLAALLLPAVSAWTAYLLCRRLTTSIWACVVGGYLYGFSTATLRQQLLGHLNLTAVFLIPLVALVILRYLRAELTRSGLAWRLGVLLACQLWISTEVALTLTLMLALALVLAFALVREARPRLLSALVPIVSGYGIGAVLAAPFVVYLLLGFVSSKFSGNLSEYGGTDLVHYVLPNRVLEIGGASFTSQVAHMPSGESAYLGLPTLLIVGVFAVRAWRTAWARFAIAALVVSVLVSLGATLQVDGHVLVSLPFWRWASHIPTIANSVPFRFATYVSLVAAVIVARWTGTSRGWVFPRPYVLPALSVVALIHAVWQSSYPSFYPSHPPRPAFFAAGLDKRCIPPKETVAIFPFGGGDALLWQAESGFRFDLAANGLEPFPKYAKPLTGFDDNAFVWDMTFVDFGRPATDRLLAFVGAHRVDRVISVIGDDYPTRAQLARLGPVERIGGVYVAPACGAPSLVQRDLSSYVRQYAGLDHTARPNIGYCIGLTFNQIPQGIDPAGLLKGARRAIMVAGQELTCAAPPAGYKRHGFATAAMQVPPGTYAYYAP